MSKLQDLPNRKCANQVDFVNENCENLLNDHTRAESGIWVNTVTRTLNEMGTRLKEKK